MADSNLLQGGPFTTNSAPTVDAGGPYSGTQNTAIALDATVTPGTDASPTLLWTETTSLGGVFSNDAIEDPTFTPDTNGSYTLRLTASPNDGSPVFDDAALTSTLVTAPTVDAGGPYPSATINLPQQLAATVTPGTDPTPTLLWTEVTSLGGTFSNTAIEDPTFTPSATGAYTLQLSADPTIGGPVVDTASLTSNAGSLPTIADVQLMLHGGQADGQTTPMVDSSNFNSCLLYTSPSPRDRQRSRMPSSA